ncbi:hypothetical protein P261_00631 [Lachnospiraceae bacterium TWA4]|nr:hypothetical protein P261_00631 [Lachnospiraceae bacterium TWA4]
MRTSAIIELFKDFLIVGIILSAIFLVGLYIQRKRGRLKEFSLKQILSSVLFICYLAVVIGATLLFRVSYGRVGIVNLELFSAYKDAWYHWSMTEWRDLVLNILLFVPMGFLIPIVFKHLQKFWQVYLLGFAASLGIETIQYIIGMGNADIDDLFNNTMGTLIGYGLWFLCFSMIHKTKNLRKIFVFQLPLILMIGVFGGLFMKYQLSPYGVYNTQRMAQNDVSGIEISTNIQFKKDSVKVPIYHTKTYTKEEVEKYADNFFKKLGTSVDPSQNDFYETTALFWSENQKYSIWVNYVGETVSFTDVSVMEEPYCMTFDQDKAVEILGNYGIALPKGISMKVDAESEEYSFTVDGSINKNEMISGSLSCKITKEGMIESLRNNMIRSERYEEVDCISEEEAYNYIKEGKFYCSVDISKDIHIKSVTLDYTLDSKGYYQPVYRFVLDDEEMIEIPAMKK